jgi:hypothetical protein
VQHADLDGVVGRLRATAPSVIASAAPTAASRREIL